MMVTRIRNRGSVPFLASEGVFEKPLVQRKVDNRREDWYADLTPYQRLHMHHTLASARRFAYFKPFPGLIPRDDLDVILTADFNQTEESFADPADVVLQPDTKNVGSWRRLRNTRDMTPDREKVASQACLKRTLEEQDEVRQPSPDGSSKTAGGHLSRKLPYRYNFAHKVLIGGVTEKKHPSNIKLMNSGHHSPQTNAGYSRQPSDGMVFQY